MADGSLKFDTKIDTDGFEKGTNTLKGMMERTASSIKRVGNGISDAFSGTGNIDTANAKIKALVDEIEQYRDGLYYLEKQGLYFGDAEYDSAYQKLARLEKELNSYKKELSSVDDGQKEASSSAKKLASSFQKTIKKSIPLTKSIFKLSNMFKLLVLRMTMRAVIRSIQEGFQSLAQYSKQANKDISALKTSMQTLQNSLATAFAPILSVVTPALQALINHLSQAISVMGQFFAVLFTGTKTFTRAKDAQVDYAKSLAKTANEANKSLSPIDKLNNVFDGGGGGYEPPIPGQMFEEVKIDEGIINFAEKAKKVLQPAAQAFKDLGDALAPIGKFAFDNILSFYDDVLKPIGKWTLGEGIPGLVKAFTNLFEDVDWVPLTKAINSFNEAIAPLAIAVGQGFIDFVVDLTDALSPVVAETVALLAKAIDAVADALSEIDPVTLERVGYTLGLVFTVFGGVKIVDELPGWLIRLGKGLSRLFLGIKDFAMFDPAGFAIVFYDLFDALDQALYTILPQWAKDLWTGFWDAVIELFSDTFNFDYTFSIFEEVAGHFRDAFSDDKPWYEIGKDIILGILKGLYGAFSFITEPIYDFLATFIKNLKKVFGINSPAKAMEPYGGYILLGILKGFTDKFGEWWKAIASWGLETVKRFSSWSNGVWATVKGVFKDVGTWFKTKFEGAWNNIRKAFAPFTGYFNGLWEGIKNGFSNALWKLKDLAKGPINAVIDILNSLIGALNKISFDIPSWVPGGLGGKTFGFNMPKIPKLATGTVVPANYGEFLAILGDNKREAEVVSPISAMKQAFKEAMTEMGGAGTGTINLNVYLEGRQIHSEVVRQDRQYKKETGKSAFAY